MKVSNNFVRLRGKLIEDFTFHHKIKDDYFYESLIEIKRESGVADTLKIIVSYKLFNVDVGCVNEYVYIEGQFRSYNYRDDQGSHLMLYVFVDNIEYTEEKSAINEIYINGFICKKPIYRVTPLDREITDLLIAVNRQFGKSDYLPCICWGRNARFMSEAEIGYNVEFSGRVQSRMYTKNDMSKIAYEISISSIEVKD